VVGSRWDRGSNRKLKKTAFEIWPNALVEGSASQELPLPKDFEQLVQDRDPDELNGKLVVGNDPDEYAEEILSYHETGYTHVYVHQIGRDQEGFLKFAKSELFRERAFSATLTVFTRR
jgi:coenzyme F420-dependent glucose-6-phosphate dehydrogenase